MEAAPVSVRRATRWGLYAVGGVVAFMGLTVLALRVLLSQVPEYREDIRRWAEQATGYGIEFRDLTASWPLSGPELRFSDVALRLPGEREPVLRAGQFAAGLSLWQLLRDWRPALGHVVVDGLTVDVEQTADGLRVQGRPLDELLPRRPSDQPPEFVLELEDINVRFLDRSRGLDVLRLGVQRLVADIARERLTLELRLEPPADFGELLELELDLPLPLPEPLALPGELQARVAGQAVALHRLLGYVLGRDAGLASATGNFVVEIERAAGRTGRLTLTTDVRDVAVETSMGLSDYERVAGELSWVRSSTGWDAAVRNLRLRRQGRNSPLTQAELRYEGVGEPAAGRWTGRAGFLRFDDIYPLLSAAIAELQPAVQPGQQSDNRLLQNLPRSASGDVRDLEFAIEPRTGARPRYSLQATFARLGLVTGKGDLAVAGLTGSVTADTDGGRLAVDSRDVRLGLPQLFRAQLPAGRMAGLLVWRDGPGGVQLISDDLELASPGISLTTGFSLQLPADGSSPVIDLKARGSATAAREVLRYLPLQRFPPKVVTWLERAVVAGNVPRVEVEFRGPLRSFPFEGDTGVFRAALDLRQATLDYANGWPRIESLDAEVIFDGVGIEARAATARLANLQVRDYLVRIPDLRTGLLGVSGAQRVDLAAILAFVRATPLSRTIGPTLARVSGAGPVDGAIRLALPIKQLRDYDLQVLFDLRRCRLALENLPFDLTELAGRVRLQNTRFTAKGVRGRLLGEPVSASLRPEAAGGPWSHTAEFSSNTPVPRITSTFGLPLRQYFGGRVAWQASVSVPSRGDSPQPLTMTLRSDLTGLTSTLPIPADKQAATSWPTSVVVRVTAPERLEISGQTAMPLAWHLRLARQDGRWRTERGALRAAAGEVPLPARRGLEVSGQLAVLPLNDWLALGGAEQAAGGATPGASPRFEELYREFDLRVARLVVAGQVFPDVEARAERGVDSWAVRVTGPAARGRLSVPFDTRQSPVTLDMERLWLLETAGPGSPGGPPVGAAARSDPRRLPAFAARVTDAAFGRWRVGTLDLALERAPDGLAIQRLSTRSAHFSITGSGGWRVEGNDPSRQVTTLEAKLESDDLRATLAELGFDPVLVGKRGMVAANLRWPDGPDGEFLTRASGKLQIELKDGQVVELEPGTGRILGLLSVTALPRRLSLDFRDVFNKGLAFDTISGDFSLGAGTAYTCNLGLTGPVADMGIVGRTSFGRRDYDQIAVVRPQVSNVLTVGGAVLGGPVGGVTMLLISQIFRKPLSTLGESYYRVSGDWSEPVVVRVQRGQLDPGAFKDCEKDVEAALQRLPGAGSGAAASTTTTP